MPETKKRAAVTILREACGVTLGSTAIVTGLILVILLLGGASFTLPRETGVMENYDNSLSAINAMTILAVMMLGGATVLVALPGVSWPEWAQPDRGGLVRPPAGWLRAGSASVAFSALAMLVAFQSTLLWRTGSFGWGEVSDQAHSGWIEGLRVSVWAGMAEEAVFLVVMIGLPLALMGRWLDQQPGRVKLSVYAALIIASSLARGSIHTYQGWDRFWHVAILGVGMAVTFVIYRSVWPLILTHILWDIIIFSSTINVNHIFFTIVATIVIFLLLLRSARGFFDKERD